MSSYHRLSKYGKPAKELLVDYINESNQRRFTVDQLHFGVPGFIGNMGLSEIPIATDIYTDLTSPATPKLKYYRVNASELPHLDPLVIHCETTTPEAIFQAIYEQYGFLIEPDSVTLTVDEAPLPVVITQTALNGIQYEGTEPPVEEEVEPAHAYNATIDFGDRHLIFYGVLDVHIRPSLKVLGTTIDSLLDLRQFYATGTHDRPPVEIYCPRGSLYVQTVEMSNRLRAFSKDDVIDTHNDISDILKSLTGDEWVSTNAVRDFNLYGTTVIQNEPLDERTDEAVAWSHALVLRLGQSCRNLSGDLRIYYRRSRPGILSQTANPASITPLWS